MDKKSKLRNKNAIISSPSPALKITKDVVFEILRRLPHKSLCRCKMVCRKWRRLISDGTFIRSHHAFHAEGKISLSFIGFFLQVNVTFHWYDYPPPKFLSCEAQATSIVSDPSLEFLFSGECEHDVIVIRALDNGLLLFEKMIGNKEDESEAYKSSYFICNPMTEQYFALPHIPENYMNPTWMPFMWEIDFNPSFSLYYFKVAVGAMTGNGVFQILFFSSKTKTWIEHIINDPKINYHSFGLSKMIILLNDVAFWIPNNEISMYGINMCLYDLKEKCLKKFPLPNTGILSVKMLMKNDGKLFYYNSTCSTIKLWVLYHTDGHKFQWELRHSIIVKELTGRNLHIFNEINQVAGTDLPIDPFVDVDEPFDTFYNFMAIAYDFELEVLFMRIMTFVIRYELKTGKVTKLLGFDGSPVFFRHCTLPILFPYSHCRALL